LKDKERSD